MIFIILLSTLSMVDALTLCHRVVVQNRVPSGVLMDFGRF